MIKPPEFIMPAKPGEAERQLLELAETGAERNLTAPEIAEAIRLIKNGADISIYDSNNRCTIFEMLVHVAIKNDAVAQLPQYRGQKLLGEIFRPAIDAASVAQLVDDGADLTQRDLYRRTALILAATANRNDIAERLIVAGVDIDAQDRDGETALMLAVRQENMALVRLLLDQGARQDLCTTYGHTALIAAVSRAAAGAIEPQRMEIALLLVAHGADPAERIEGGSSALDRLAASGCTDAYTSLQAAAAAYRRTAKERAATPREDTPAMKTLQLKKPGDKFKLKPKPPQP